MIQERIRSRRVAFGASVEAMADWARLPRDRWRAIESGKPMSTAELGNVARALAVDAGTLLSGEERSPRRSVARFRQAFAADAETNAIDSRVLALAAELGRIGGGLYRLLGRSRSFDAGRSVVPVAGDEEPWRQGYILGETARRSLGIPVGPISDLLSTLESIGVHVAFVRFSEPSIDAASLMEKGAMPMLLLNRSSPRIEHVLPCRAAMAHELCHLLHDAGEHDLETRMSRSGDEVHDDPAERRAPAFAPAFLAPRDEVRLFFNSGEGLAFRDPSRKVAALARRWGLSWQGAAWHAKNCKLISAVKAEELATEAPKASEWSGDFESKPLPTRFTLPEVVTSELCDGHLADVVGAALESGVISEARAEEILTWA